MNMHTKKGMPTPKIITEIVILMATHTSIWTIQVGLRAPMYIAEHIKSNICII